MPKPDRPAGTTAFRTTTGTALLLLLWLAGPAGAAPDPQNGPGAYGFGTPAAPEQVAARDIDVGPDGEGLPPGSGTAAEGEAVYQARCQTCHGPDLQGVSSTGGVPLVGGRGTLDDPEPKKTVESYWPYATTLYDYVRRAMPFDQPGSLSDEEVYAVVAYILSRADVIGRGREMNARTLPEVRMPNRDGFVPDDRPDVHRYR